MVSLSPTRTVVLIVRRAVIGRSLSGGPVKPVISSTTGSTSSVIVAESFNRGVTDNVIPTSRS